VSPRARGARPLNAAAAAPGGLRPGPGKLDGAHPPRNSPPPCGSKTRPNSAATHRSFARVDGKGDTVYTKAQDRQQALRVPFVMGLRGLFSCLNIGGFPGKMLWIRGKLREVPLKGVGMADPFVRVVVKNFDELVKRLYHLATEHRDSFSAKCWGDWEDACIAVGVCDCGKDIEYRLSHINRANTVRFIHELENQGVADYEGNIAPDSVIAFVDAERLKAKSRKRRLLWDIVKFGIPVTIALTALLHTLLSTSDYYGRITDLESKVEKLQKSAIVAPSTMPTSQPVKED